MPSELDSLDDLDPKVALTPYNSSHCVLAKARAAMVTGTVLGAVTVDVWN